MGRDTESRIKIRACAASPQSPVEANLLKKSHWGGVWEQEVWCVGRESALPYRKTGDVHRRPRSLSSGYKKIRIIVEKWWGGGSGRGGERKKKIRNNVQIRVTHTQQMMNGLNYFNACKGWKVQRENG